MFLRFVALALVTFGLTSAAFAGVAAPKTPAKAALCAGCHGMDGKGLMSTYPNLGGQHDAYLEITLKQFKSGARQNPMMTSMALGLNDEEIAELAAYYSAKPLVIAANGDASAIEIGRNKAGYCMGCHGKEGVPVAPEFPIIAGQDAAYIEAQLKAYRDGGRDHPYMTVVARKLDDAMIKGLAAYYSQLKPTR